MQNISQTNFSDSVRKVKHYWDRNKVTSSSSAYKDKWKAIAQTLNKTAVPNGAIVFLWDTTVNEFTYFSENINKLSGYNDQHFLGKAGIELSLNNIHPDQLQGVWDIQIKALEACKSCGKNINDYFFSWDFLYRNSNELYVHMLQQTVVAELNEEGQPVLFINSAQDITHLKRKNSVTGIIKTLNSLQILHYDVANKLLLDIDPLTTRELEILQFLFRGEESKVIASILNISPHTVDTHRRNLLQKTNCRDTTALVSYARMVGIVV
jgi:DNA-binding CsgD family transcriptional regulator